MTDDVKKRDPLEERLMPWIEQGEYVIVLTLTIMAWTAGWVNVIAYQSREPIILGRYSPSYLLILLPYTLVFVPLLWMFGTLKGIEFFKKLIDSIQQRPYLFAALWAVFMGIFISMFVNPTAGWWERFALLEGVVLFLMVLFTLVILLARPVATRPVALWRKVIIGIIGSLLGIELLLQGLAVVGLYPVEIKSGIAVPYGRVYQNEVGLGNGVTNRHGWYYPDFPLQEENSRIILSGGSVLQALQIPKKNHMGVLLQEQMEAGGAQDIEVLALGQPGYGSSYTINTLMSFYIWEPLEPDEIVIFFHLTNDFQMGPESGSLVPPMVIDEAGEAIVPEDEFQHWHELAHIVIAGHDPMNPLVTLRTHSLLLNLLNQAAGDTLPMPDPAPYIPQHTDQTTSEEWFGPASPVYTDGSDTEAFTLAEAQLRTFIEYMNEQNIRVRLVTIPYFPPEFYATMEETDWSREIGDYDLLLPEDRLAEIAQELDISFLGMTRRMQQESVSAIRELYFEENGVYLTKEGHAFFTETLYDCFYATEPSLDESAGCLP